MIKFLKKLFTSTAKTIVEKVNAVKEKRFDESLLEGLTLNYKLDLSKFGGQWITGNGDYDHKSGINHQWYGPESVVLEDEQIHLKSEYKPVFVMGETFEYCVGRVNSSKQFFYGYYEFEVELPKSGFMSPKIELMGDGETVTLMSVYSNAYGEYFKSVTKVDGKVEECDVELLQGDTVTIGCYYHEEGIEIYHNGLMVREIKREEPLLGPKVKISMINSLQPEVEGIRVDNSVFKIVELTHYRKK
jgi:hypothetical protein